LAIFISFAKKGICVKIFFSTFLKNNSFWQNGENLPAVLETM
jgi:hypothetical protein